MFSISIIFLIISQILLIKQIESDLNSTQICRKNSMKLNEICGRQWYYECGHNLCMTDKDACDTFNEIERIVKIKEM